MPAFFSSANAGESEFQVKDPGVGVSILVTLLGCPVKGPIAVAAIIEASDINPSEYHR